MKPKRKFLGYQIVNKDLLVPDEFASFEIIQTHKILDDFFRSQKAEEGKKWTIVPIYTEDIEEPSFL